jgi:hypothetical protein
MDDSMSFLIHYAIWIVQYCEIFTQGTTCEINKDPLLQNDRKTCDDVINETMTNLLSVRAGTETLRSFINYPGLQNVDS